jgi:hypothetical protein
MRLDRKKVIEGVLIPRMRSSSGKRRFMAFPPCTLDKTAVRFEWFAGNSEISAKINSRKQTSDGIGGPARSDSAVHQVNPLTGSTLQLTKATLGHRARMLTKLDPEAKNLMMERVV